MSNDKKETSYKFPLLHKLPYIGEKLFTSNSVIERKTDLIIQITPKIIQDKYTGIAKSSAIKAYEDYVIDDAYKSTNDDQFDPDNEKKLKKREVNNDKKY